jgi:hypothetical protein
VVEDFEKLKKRCKYEIICPNIPKKDYCSPSNCQVFERAEREISEKDLSQAILYEPSLEDMRDF